MKFSTFVFVAYDGMKMRNAGLIMRNADFRMLEANNRMLIASKMMLIEKFLLRNAVKRVS